MEVVNELKRTIFTTTTTAQVTVAVALVPVFSTARLARQRRAPGYVFRSCGAANLQPSAVNGRRRGAPTAAMPHWLNPQRTPRPVPRHHGWAPIHPAWATFSSSSNFGGGRRDRVRLVRVDSIITHRSAACHREKRRHPRLSSYRQQGAPGNAQSPATKSSSARFLASTGGR